MKVSRDTCSPPLQALSMPMHATEDYISTDFHVDSSCNFPFRAQTDGETDRQTDTQRCRGQKVTGWVRIWVMMDNRCGIATLDLNMIAFFAQIACNWEANALTAPVGSQADSQHHALEVLVFMRLCDS